MAPMPSRARPRPSPSKRRPGAVPDPFDPRARQAFRQQILARHRRRWPALSRLGALDPRGLWSWGLSRLWPLVAILFFGALGLPLADALAGARATGGRGCQLLAVLSGDSVLLACPGQGIAPLALAGVQAPPILGARCMAEGWAGLQAVAALHWRIWQAERLSFVRQGSHPATLALADGRPLPLQLPEAPQDLCL